MYIHTYIEVISVRRQTKISVCGFTRLPNGKSRARMSLIKFSYAHKLLLLFVRILRMPRTDLRVYLFLVASTFRYSSQPARLCVRRRRRLLTLFWMEIT
jgi:hypothetical protein